MGLGPGSEYTWVPDRYIHRLCALYSVVHKTISLSDEAYQRLTALKQPGESFTDVVCRLTRRRSLTELAGIVPPAAADSIARAVEQNRTDRERVRRRELGLA